MAGRSVGRLLLVAVAVLLLLAGPIAAAAAKEAAAAAAAAVVALDSGLKVRFTAGPAAGTLQRWAAELDRHGGSVSFGEAVAREQHVVDRIHRGEWTMAAYHEYQRFAAGTGNVDSAGLLMAYGIGQSLHELALSREVLGRLHARIAACDLRGFQELIEEQDLSIDIVSEDGTTFLMAAAFHGCLSVARYLLVEQQGVEDIEASGANGLTALMTAASRGHVAVLELLIAHGAAVNAKHKFAASTALHFAAEMDQAEAIRVLCRHGADPRLLTATESTPLHTAAHANASFETVEALVRDCQSDIGALLNEDTTPLYLAAQHGHVRTVEALLHLGADPHFAMPFTAYRGDFSLTPHGAEGLQFAAKPINTAPGNGAEAIHAAAENGHAAVVEVLLAHGADPNTLSMSVTPLHLAAQYNRPDVARALLRHPDTLVDKKAYTDGGTALYYATGHGFLEVMKVLLEHGASQTERHDKSGGFPLLYAALTNRPDALMLLLSADRSAVDLRAPDGLSPLIAAANAGHAGMVGQLLAAGADPCARNTQDQSALHVAIEHGSSGVVSQLLRRLRAPDCPCSDILHQPDKVTGFAPVHLAARKSKPDILQALLAAGCDPNQRVGHPLGPTPVFLAISSAGATKSLAALLGVGNAKTATSTTAAAAAAGSASLVAQDESFFGTKVSVTPLIWAIHRKNQAAVALLLQQGGADPNRGSPDAQGIYQNPVLLATVRGQASILQLLLDAGASCHIQVRATAGSDRLDSLMDLAQSRRDFDTLQVLSRHPRCQHLQAASEL